MWKVRDPARYAAALSHSHRVSTRVEVWSDGHLITSAAPFIDGAVTDKWIPAGIRRSLEITVAPTKDWVTWLALPLLEFRPYRGIRYAANDIDECPLGRYPIMPPARNRPVGAIKIQADDYYQRVIQAGFTSPYRARLAPAAQRARSLIEGFAGMQPAVVISKDTSVAMGVVLDKTRHDALVDLARSFSLEIYLDRQGVPTVADEMTLGTPLTSVLVGTGGTVEALAVKPDWDKVFNVVSVTSTARNVSFPPQVAEIDDINNPAAPWRIGARTKNFASKLIPNADSALAAAWSLVARLSQSAITYNYTCVPDVRRDAGDTIRGSTMTGTANAMISEITHPLTVDGRQQITTVSTQPDTSDEG